MPNWLKDPVDNLIYEIVDHIDFWWKWDWNFLKWHGETRDTIKKYLSPYLHMPQPIENEPNYDAACMYVVVHGLNITAEDVKWILKASSVPTNPKDNEPLPDWESDDQ